MKRPYCLVATLLVIGALAFAPQPSYAATSSCNPSALLARLAAATGANAWNGVAELTARGKASSSGLRGTAELHYDVLHGRYARRFMLPVQGASAEVYDGRVTWARDISGGVHPYDSWYPRARAVTEAYIVRRGYANPRDAAALTCLGAAKNGSALLIRVVPRGGVPATLSIDAQTGLLNSVTIRTPISTDVTTYGDYRHVGALVVPFSIESGSTFEPADGYAIAVTRYAVARRVDEADFQKPTEARNAHMIGGATSTTVPLALEARQLLIWASIDGHPPMPFILDSGGHAILDTVAAKALGLHGSGAGVSGGAGSGTVALQYTRVKSVRIGNAELTDQPFLIIPYPYAFYERGTKVPLAGILGLEWFERFATRIDYANHRLTLTPLATFRSRTGAAALPIRFQEDMPLAHAAADGNGGWFGVDTGNAGPLVLYGTFLRRSGLLAKYARGYTIAGGGTGGANTGSAQTLADFTIAGHKIRHLAADFTQMKTGSFSSWTEAGDLGLTVLSQFTPTFDYARETIYLQPLSHPLVIPPNRAGLGFAKLAPSAFTVVVVKPGSVAAAAGIMPGDRILAVNGTNANELSVADLLDIVTAAPGTRVHLLLEKAATKKTVSIVLR